MKNRIACTVFIIAATLALTLSACTSQPAETPTQVGSQEQEEAQAGPASFSEEALNSMGQGDYVGALHFVDAGSREEGQIESVIKGIRNINDACKPAATHMASTVTPQDCFATFSERRESLEKASASLREASDIDEAAQVADAIDEFLAIDNVSVEDFDLLQISMGRTLTSAFSYGEGLSENDIRRYVVAWDVASVAKDDNYEYKEWQSIAPVFDSVYCGATSDGTFITVYPKDEPVEDKLLGQQGWAYYDFQNYSDDTLYLNTYDGPQPLETIDMGQDSGAASGGTPYHRVDLDSFNAKYGGNVLKAIEFAFAQNYAIGEFYTTDIVINLGGDQTSSSESDEKAERPTVGMSEEEALSTEWGEPDEKNITETKNGIHEQWIYDDYGYVYLDNGEVTSIQRKGE